MKDIRDQTYYELLEVEPTASQEEILKAYNRARATYGNNNPALYSLFNKEEAQDLLKLIDEAYSILGNQFKRKEYDTKATGTGSLMEPPPLPRVQEKAYSPQERKSGMGDKFNRNIPTQSVTQTPTKPKIELKKNSGNLTPFGEYVKDQQFEDEIRTAEEYPGSFIQKVRLYKNITLDQISESVKVSRSYLLAIESNNFSSLPAPVFVRGFLVQIAKILGLDPNKVTTSYMKQLKDAQKK
jgi:curved DNA-binding protein CbpA